MVDFCRPGHKYTYVLLLLLEFKISFYYRLNTAIHKTALRRVHTNPLKCALDQIASSRFEPIRIRSVHTLFTESEFDYGLPKIYCEAHNNMKVYLEIYAI